MEIKEIVAAIPMTNTERAIQFYKNKLSLQVETLSEKAGMYWVKANGSKFLL